MDFHTCCMSYGTCDCDPRDAEITQLRAELAAERELVDRLYAELLTWTGGEDEMNQPHEVELVSLYRTRRNK